MASPKISSVSQPVGVSSAPFSASVPYTAPLIGGGAAVEPRTRNRLPVLFAAAVLLSATALGISGYLTYVAFTSSKVLGCGGGTFDCEHVLNSKWSTLLGVPVAAWASSLYLSVLATLIVAARPAMSTSPSPMRTAAWSIVTAAGVSAGLAALWFTGLQVFVLKHLCPWCLGAHSCGLLLCIATLTMSPLAGRLKWLCAAAGALGAATLIATQIATPAPPTYIIEQFPTPSIETSNGAEVFEEPEMFDAPTGGDDVLAAPGSDEDVFLAPDVEAASEQPATEAAPAVAPADASEPVSAAELQRWGAQLSLLFQPALLLTAQVGSETPAGSAAPAAQAAQQNTPAAGQGAASQDAAAAASNDRLVQVASANVKLKAHQWPIIGSPNAKHIFVELFDYTCPHCRATQQTIRGARERYKDDLAIIVLAVPLSRACNDTVTSEHPSHRESCELAKYAIAVWRVAPDKFQEYHEWLMSAEPVPSAAIAKAKAAQLVGSAELEKELAQPNASRYISKHVEIYRKMGAGPIPKLVFANTVLTGEIRSVQQLCDVIEGQSKR